MKCLVGFLLSIQVSTVAMAETLTQVLSVKGMVCELCAQGIKKKLGAESEVKDVDVKVKDQKVTITYKDSQKILDEKRLRDLLEDAGYELDKIN